MFYTEWQMLCSLAQKLGYEVELVGEDKFNPNFPSLLISKEKVILLEDKFIDSNKILWVKDIYFKPTKQLTREEVINILNKRGI